MLILSPSVRSERPAPRLPGANPPPNKTSGLFTLTSPEANNLQIQECRMDANVPAEIPSQMEEAFKRGDISASTVGEPVNYFRLLLPKIGHRVPFVLNPATVRFREGHLRGSQSGSSGVIIA